MASKKVITDTDKIKEVLTRGVEEVIDFQDLFEKMSSGKPLRIKLGIDPTSAYLHLGRTIPLMKLRDFQELGHTAVFIVGDFTATIGDTSDKDSERPMLTIEQVKENLQTYKKQVAKILDMEKTEFHFNSQWLKKLNFNNIAELADLFSVHQFISRENIRKRLEEGKRVSLREVLYPLMQGYDSVAVHADVELGGTDQRFNLLAGRDMQPYFQQTPQNIVMTPLVEGLDGRKMSSSWGNTVNVMDSADEMYGKIMSLHDNHIVMYLVTMTRIPFAEVFEIRDALSRGENPKIFKMRLARELVGMYHSLKKAELAELTWRTAFEDKKIPENVQKVSVTLKFPLVDLLVKQGLVKSKTEFRRLVNEGAITFHGKLEERKIVDPASLVEESGALRIGKKRFLQIIVKKK